MLCLGQMGHGIQIAQPDFFPVEKKQTDTAIVLTIPVIENLLLAIEDVIRSL